ncbi:MAG: cupredoxin domain-containing protein [Nitriliruptoraceae bacterium]|nr:cupredoxin domain-containing protein [Nitriliruptoraceae bacterium]
MMDRSHQPTRPLHRRLAGRRAVAGLAVAALALAACGGGDTAEPATSGGSSTLSVEAGDLYYEPSSLTTSAGTIEVTLDNVGAIEHDLIVEEAGELDAVGMVAPGDTGTGTIELEAGTYTVYCSVPGHRGGGMEATLEVS